MDLDEGEKDVLSVLLFVSFPAISLRFLKVCRKTAEDWNLFSLSTMHCIARLMSNPELCSIFNQFVALTLVIPYYESGDIAATKDLDTE